MISFSDEQITGALLGGVVFVIGWIFKGIDSRLSECEKKIDEHNTKITVVETNRTHDSETLDEILRRITAMFAKFDLFKDAMLEKLAKKQDK